ncbi:hypothetical protein ABKZ05_003834 [Vibrio navarrensis]
MAFLACGDLSGENGLRKVGLGGIRPLTRRYDSRYYDSEHYYFRLYCSGGARISSCETSQR